MEKFFQLFIQYWLQIVLALIPFAPNLYEALFTEQSVQFLYEKKYTKSPIEEWNRAVVKFTKALDPDELRVKSPPPQLLQAIGKEISKSMPAMLAGIGFKPFDSLTVTIYNQSNKDLVNTRVNFIGCKDHFEILTAPDSTGSIVNSSSQKSENDKAITVNYGRIARKGIGEYLTQITYYGIEASKCVITVDAERDNGIAARGEEVQSIQERVNSEYSDLSARKRNFDLAWKLFISIFIIYLFTSLRKLKRSKYN